MILPFFISLNPAFNGEYISARAVLGYMGRRLRSKGVVAVNENQSTTTLSSNYSVQVEKLERNFSYHFILVSNANQE